MNPREALATSARSLMADLQNQGKPRYSTILRRKQIKIDEQDPFYMDVDSAKDYLARLKVTAVLLNGSRSKAGYPTIRPTQNATYQIPSAG